MPKSLLPRLFLVQIVVSAELSTSKISYAVVVVVVVDPKKRYGVWQKGMDGE